MLKTLQELRQDPNYTISESGKKTIVKRLSPQLSYVPEEYVFDSTTEKLIGGAERSLLDNDVPFNRVVYDRTQEGKLEVRTYQNRGQSYKLLEREVYDDSGQREQYQLSQKKTALQKANVAKQEAKVQAVQGRYVPKNVGQPKALKDQKTTIVYDPLIKESTLYNPQTTPGNYKAIEEGRKQTVYERSIKEQEQNVKKKEKLVEQPKVKLFGGYNITEAPPKTIGQKITSYISKSEGTLGGIALGSAYTGYKYTIGYIKGRVALFNPKTYTSVFKSIKNFNIEKARESLYYFGQELKTNPAAIPNIAESVGYYKGFGKTTKQISETIPKYVKPKVLSTKGSLSITTEYSEGTTTATRSVAKVKVGKKTYDVFAETKEYGINIKDNFQKFISKSKFTTGKVKGSQLTMGQRTLTPTSSTSIANYLVKVEKGKDNLYQLGKTGTISTVVAEDTGFKTQASLSVSKAGKLQKVEGKDISKIITNVNRDLKPLAAEKSLSQETAKIGSVTYSKELGREIRGKPLNQYFNQLNKLRKPDLVFQSKYSGKLLHDIKTPNTPTLKSAILETAKQRYILEVKPATKLAVPKITPQIKTTTQKPVKPKIITQPQQQIQINITPQKTKPTVTSIYGRQKSRINIALANKPSTVQVQKTFNIQQPKVEDIVKTNQIQKAEVGAKPIVREMTEQKQALAQLQVTKTLPTYRTINPTFPLVPIIKAPSITFSFFKKDGSGLKQSYDVFVGSGKREKLVAKRLPLGKALKIGAETTLSNLRARFRLQPAGTTKLEDISYKVPREYFREYKIRKQKKIETPFEFIQRRGKRLSSQSEVQEIKLAKRKSIARF